MILEDMGNFKFRDVTKEVGLNEKWPTLSAVWTDFNNDGWIDLFIANESSPKGENNGLCRGSEFQTQRHLHHGRIEKINQAQCIFHRIWQIRQITTKPFSGRQLTITPTQ